MAFDNDRIIMHPLPFLKTGMVLYVAGQESPALDWYVLQHESEIRKALSESGFRFICLPVLFGNIPEDALDYLFPLQKDVDLDALHKKIRETAGLGNLAGLLYREGSFIRYRELEGNRPDTWQERILDLAVPYPESECEVASKETVLFRKKGSRAAHKAEWIKSLPLNEPEIYESSIRFRIVEDNDNGEEWLDEKTAAILEEIDGITRKFGDSIEEIEVLLGYRVKLSHLQISRRGRILLSDFGKEVRMNQLSKAFFFLFLRHPEGIRFKEVSNHRKELLDIYLGITGRAEQTEIEKTIDKLIDPFGNEMNVCASRIKAAFRNAVSERVARFYYLEGSAGEIKKVPLDRDFVIWEH